MPTKLSILQRLVSIIDNVDVCNHIISYYSTYIKSNTAEAESQIKEYENEIGQIEDARLKNADTTKREQLLAKRNRIKAILAQIPELEGEIEELRAEQAQHTNHKQDLERQVEDLDRKIRKFGFEMKKARTNWDIYKKRQNQSQGGFQMLKDARISLRNFLGLTFLLRYLFESTL